MRTSSTERVSDIRTLELRLYESLGIPIEQDRDAPERIERTPEAPLTSTLRDLRRELFELRKEASQIGAIPLHYPSHIVVVMKVISALLPWYTRPLLHFAQRTVHTADLTAQLIEEAIKSQERLDLQIADLRNRVAHTAKPDTQSRSDAHTRNGAGRPMTNEDSYFDQRAGLR